MNIRTRLTVIYSIIVMVLLAVVSLAIYFFSADYREEDFYQRLKSKSISMAQLLLDVEEVDANLLLKIEKDNPTNLPNERITILNYKNEVLFTTDIDRVIKIDSSVRNEIRLGNEVRFTINEYEVLGLLYTEQYDRITVLAAAIDIYGYRKLNNLRNILLLIFLISILVVPLSGWIYAGRSLQPISNLVRQTETISADQLNRRLYLTNTTDEIGKLAQTFNQMLDRLEKAFLAQKHFIANASHELRTPLTAMTGEIQVTLIQSRTPAKYQEVLKSVLEEIKSLSHLSNQLLLLAQTSTETSRELKNKLRADELVWQVKEDLEDSSPDYQINVLLDKGLDDDVFTVWGDEQLLRTAFINLMDNGCKYSTDQKVEVFLSKRKNTLLCEFRNSCVDIDGKDLVSIFQPFFRGSNIGNVKGHGIGLSLVSRIVELHAGTIKVSSAQGTTNFSMSLPIANRL